MVRYVFFLPFVAPNQKMPIETTVTVQKLPENQTQRSFIRSTSKMIHLPCIFIIRKGRYGSLCVFVAIFSNNGRTACRNHSNSPKTARNLDTEFIHQKYIKNDPSLMCFCYQEGQIWLIVCFVAIFAYKWQKCPQKPKQMSKNCQKIRHRVHSLEVYQK